MKGFGAVLRAAFFIMPPVPDMGLELGAIIATLLLRKFAGLPLRAVVRRAMRAVGPFV